MQTNLVLMLGSVLKLNESVVAQNENILKIGLSIVAQNETIIKYVESELERHSKARGDDNLLLDLDEKSAPVDGQKRYRSTNAVSEMKDNRVQTNLFDETISPSCDDDEPGFPFK